MGKVTDLTDKQFGEWTVLKYAGDSNWICKCSCGRISSVHSYRLRKGLSKSCGHNTTRLRDLTKETFGEWTPIKRVDGKWLCKCSCGTERLIRTGDLTSGHTRSCGHATTGFRDLTGEVFGDWEVLKYTGNQYWECKCKCGTVSSVHTYKLTSGISKSCGHDTTKFKDLTGKQIGYWEVISYLGDRYWRCKCICGNERNIHAETLNLKKSLSCGCKSREMANNTMLDKYGVTHIAKLNTDRTPDQLSMIESRQSIIKTIKDNFNNRPYINELSQLFGITESMVLKYIHKYSLEDMVTIGNTHTSSYERELKQRYPEAKTDRKVLNGYELDMLFEEYKIAAEFNGNYWHSDLLKHKLYHQNKTLECAKNKVHLIHIFEYEWTDGNTRNKLLDHIDRYVRPEENNIIMARKCDISQISFKEAKDFLDLYHLQNCCTSSIQIGLHFNNELVGVMTFGKPRYNKEFQYELLRLAFKRKTIVVGGAQRLFQYFIGQCHPTSVISYCDISKFWGDVYARLGFNGAGLTSPNYVWVHNNSGKVLKRYDTMIHKLIEEGLAQPEDTETTAMERLGYLRIYDCGNLRFEWRRNN